MIKELIILAGGFGTRLNSVVNNVPKPMAEVNGKPFLHYLFKQVEHISIERAVLAVHHKKESIMSFFKDEYKGIKVSYSIEEEALGTGGGIKQALKECFLSESILIMNGDSYLDEDLSDFIAQHIQSGANFSMLLKEVEDVSRYGAVEITNNNKVCSFLEKGARSGRGLINSGIYLLNKEQFVKEVNQLDKFSLEKEFLEPKGKEKEIHAVVSSGYFIDIGIPEDFARAQHEFKRFEN